MLILGWEGGQNEKSKGCKTRKEAVEDRDHLPVSDEKVIGP